MRFACAGRLWSERGAMIRLVDIGILPKGGAIVCEGCDSPRLRSAESLPPLGDGAPSLRRPSLSDNTAISYSSSAVLGFHLSSSANPSSCPSIVVLSRLVSR